MFSEAIRRGPAVIGTKPMAGGALPQQKAVKVEEAFRYVWSLPVTTVLVGCDSSAILKKTVRLVQQFALFHAGEMDAVRQKARPTAGDGRHERYKTTQAFDGLPGQIAHGFLEKK